MHNVSNDNVELQPRQLHGGIGEVVARARVNGVDGAHAGRTMIRMLESILKFTEIVIWRPVLLLFVVYKRLLSCFFKVVFTK
jgi:hypothetical protein